MKVLLVADEHYEVGLIELKIRYSSDSLRSTATILFSNLDTKESRVIDFGQKDCERLVGPLIFEVVHALEIAAAQELSWRDKKFDSSVES